jgi:hypothetical protein
MHHKGDLSFQQAFALKNKWLPEQVTSFLSCKLIANLPSPHYNTERVDG